MKLLFIIIGILALAGCTGSQETVSVTTLPAPPPTVDPSDAVMLSAQGNYDLYCAHCHGYAGAGQPTGGGPGSVEWVESLGYHTVPLHNSEGHTWQHPDQLLFEVIKYGIDNPLSLYVMSAHSDRLNDDEIWGVIDYMKLFWTEDQRDYQAQLTEQFATNQPNWAPDHRENSEDSE